MSFKIPTFIAVLSFLLGGGLLVIPNEWSFYVGISMLALFGLIGLWISLAWLKFKRIEKLVNKKVYIRFIKADFQAIGMANPCIDFYFNVHSCLSTKITLSGGKRGELRSVDFEVWRDNWLVDAKYPEVINPGVDTEIKVSYYASQAYHSLMSELAFCAKKDNPPVHELTFEDMCLEVRARILKFERNVGWLQLSQSPVEIRVPDHPTFRRIRQVYEHDKEL